MHHDGGRFTPAEPCRAGGIWHVCGAGTAGVRAISREGPP
jgi:hypothetical protein